MQCVSLDQDAIEIKRAEQLLEFRLLTGFVRVVGRLGQGHAKGSGVIAYNLMRLGNLLRPAAMEAARAAGWP